MLKSNWWYVDVCDKFGFVIPYLCKEFNFREQAVRYAENYPSPNYSTTIGRV